jgi:protease-4
MTDKSPGPIGKFFGFFGKIFRAIRTLISVIFVGFFILIIAGMFGENLPPMPEQGALYLAPSGILVDQRSYVYPTDQLLADPNTPDSETLVRDIIDAIDAARFDSRISHLVLDTDFLQAGGIAKLEEISGALMRFKQSEKPIFAVADNYNQSQYFLAAHADYILLNPMGSVMLTGFGAYSNYYRDALDKLNINVHIFRAGEFKNAVEPFSRNNMSDETKAQVADIINSLWDYYSSQIEDLRSLNPGSIDNIANNLHIKLRDAKGNAALLAISEGLVDQLASRQEMRNFLNQKIPSDQDGEFYATDINTYLAHIRREQSSLAQAGDKVAVLFAKGTIFDGEQPEGNVGGDTLANIINGLEYDNQVKAIVLRVDSPGGSAFASEIIRDSLENISARDIPVVVSMGSYAASGGYWVSAQADKILAMPTTITGSIGVYSMIPTFEDSLASLGIYSDGVGSTDIAGIMQLDRPMSEQTKIIAQASVDNVYSRFIKLVANGRQKTSDEIEEIARGRIWTGAQALELGLIDQLGDLDSAIEAAAELAGISSYEVIYPSRLLSPYELFIQEISNNISGSLAWLGLGDWLFTDIATSVFSPLSNLSRFNDPSNIYMHCDACPM